MFKASTLVFAALLWLADTQRPTPCPNIFRYEPRPEGQVDKWTGIISVTSTDELEGIWLQLSLDYRAHVLLNWFGEATSSNNRDYTIRNTGYKLSAGATVPVKLQVSYNAADRIPSLYRIRLNGRTICAGTAAPIAPITTSTTTEATVAQMAPQATPDLGPDAIPIPDDTSETNTEVFLGDLELFANQNSSASTGGSFLPSIDVPCGTVASKGRPLITRGQDSVEGDWPWHVAIYTPVGRTLRYICGGSLISKRHVLTAAHCATKPGTQQAGNVRGYVIFLGRTNLNKTGTMTQNRRVDKITVHPQYNSTYYYNDVAILRLSNPVDVTDFVRPVCLWSQGPQVSVVGKLGYVVGWGFTEREVITDHLQETQMPVVDALTCIFSNRNFYNRFTSPTTFCAGFRNGTSVCNGDSGGGMFFPNLGPNNEPESWEIRGMVSLSLVLQQKVCDPYNYVVFTDVAHFVNWIKQNMN